MSALLTYLFKTQPAFREGRLRSLYSDFESQRLSNPEGFQANVIAWESALISATRAGLLGSNRFVIHFGSKLQHLLQLREHGLPQGLKNVEEESATSKHLVSLDYFLKSATSLNSNENVHLMDLPVKALIWALKQVGLSERNHIDPKHQYIPLQSVEQSSERVILCLRQRTRRLDRVLPIAELRQIIAHSLSLEELANLDFAVFLKHLSRDKRFISYNETTVKIRAQDELSANIEVEDTQISELKAVLSKMRAEFEVITQKAAEMGRKAREAVANKRRAQALSALKSKNLFESALSKRGDILIQLEDVLLKIGAAADQVEIVKAMEGSTQVLRALNQEVGGIDRVDTIVEELQEEMTKAEEISTAIGSDVQFPTDLDDAEIDEELRRLELETSVGKQQQQQQKIPEQLQDLVSSEQLESIEMPESITEISPSVSKKAVHA